jgi:hypothetical protein
MDEENNEIVVIGRDIFLNLEQEWKQKHTTHDHHHHAMFGFVFNLCSRNTRHH